MNEPVVNIRALASMARLEVSDEELARLEKELPAILSFVETVQKVSVQDDIGDTSHRNVMRADENPHESGIFTEVLLNAAPARDGNYVVVKQVLSKNKK